MKDDPNVKDILSILIDEPSLKIMKLLDKRELSTQNISSTLNIPISSTYRKIKKLEQLKIIKTSKSSQNIGWIGRIVLYFIHKRNKRYS